MKRIIALALLCLAAAGTQAQIVGANTQRESLIKPKKQLPEYRPTDGFLQIEAGFPSSIAVGAQLNSSVMVAGGIGIGSSLLNEQWRRREAFLPLFLEARLSTPKYNFAVFADLRLEFDIIKQWDDQFMEGQEFLRYPVTQLQLGIMWRDFSIGIGPILFFDEQRWDGYYKSGLNWDLSLSASYRLNFESIKRALY